VALSLDVVTAAAEVPALRVDVLERTAEQFRGALLPRLSFVRKDRALWTEDTEE
jgi:hypothetical protein